LRSPAVIRLRVFFGTALALGAIVVSFVNAQLTDEEKKAKRDARAKAREEMRAIESPTPAETPEPKAKPKPAKRKSKKKPTATPTPAARKKKATPEPDETPAAKSKANSEADKSGDEDEDVTPKSKRTDSGESSESPEPAKKPVARKSPTPEPDESPAAKSKPKSGTKKSGKGDEEATPKPKHKKRAEPEESPEPVKKHGAQKSPTPEPDETPTPKSSTKKKTDAPEAAPKRIEKAEPVKTPVPIEKPPKTASEPARPPISEPLAHPRPASRPPLPQAVLPADITVEKSGLEKEQGLEPPPPPPSQRGFWPFSRQPANYRYLTSATIDAIRRAPVQRGRWKFVIVHNSGTRQGNARAFDYYHRKIRRMRNGLAYHFVIGNGTSSRNGQIEIGDRWRRQINGGHVHSDYMNNIGLGICLVGDFNRDQPTRAQLEACEELIKYLQERCGKSDGRSLIVRPHREVNPPRWATDCPGDAFPYGWFGRFR
jgi:hypothetical protein